MPTNYVFPQRPSIDGLWLWPQANYAVNCQPSGIKQARDYKGRVTGMVRQNIDGSFDVLMTPAVNADGTTDFDSEVWAPLTAANMLYANIYYRIGPCWVGGHGHGEDGEVGNHALYAREVLGLDIEQNGMEDVDIRYYPVSQSPWGLRYLRSEYNKLHPAPVEPTKPPVVPPTPALPTLPTLPTLPVQPPVEPPPQPAPPLAGPPSTKPALSAEARATVAILRRKLATGKQGRGGLTVLIGPDYRPKLETLLDELDKLT